MDLSGKVLRTIPEFVLSVRAELELSIDAEEYRQLTLDWQQRSQQAGKEAVQRLQVELAALIREHLIISDQPKVAAPLTACGPATAAKSSP